MKSLERVREHQTLERVHQTRTRGPLEDEYAIYLACANDGKGGDITRPGQPLKSFDEWLAS